LLHTTEAGSRIACISEQLPHSSESGVGCPKTSMTQLQRNYVLVSSELAHSMVGEWWVLGGY